MIETEGEGELCASVQVNRAAHTTHTHHTHTHTHTGYQEQIAILMPNENVGAHTHLLLWGVRQLLGLRRGLDLAA